MSNDTNTNGADLVPVQLDGMTTAVEFSRDELRTIVQQSYEKYGIERESIGSLQTPPEVLQVVQIEREQGALTDAGLATLCSPYFGAQAPVAIPLQRAHNEGVRA